MDGDIRKQMVRVLSDGVVSMRDPNRAMNWSLPDKDAAIVAGLLIHQALSIPDVGQAFAFQGF
jgi:Mg2+/Co2+ transporter CorB